MGLRTMSVNAIDRLENGAGILYDSTTMRALPWIFDSAEDADAFSDWVHGERGEESVRDFRILPKEEQRTLFDEWRKVSTRRERELEAARAERDLRAVSR